MEKKANYILAVILGLIAGAIGIVIWGAVVEFTGYEHSYISMIIGAIVGSAVMYGSGKVGGIFLQILSVVITLVSIMIAKSMVGTIEDMSIISIFIIVAGVYVAFRIPKAQVILTTSNQDATSTDSPDDNTKNQSKVIAFGLLAGFFGSVLWLTVRYFVQVPSPIVNYIIGFVATILLCVLIGKAVAYGSNNTGTSKTQVTSAIIAFVSIYVSRYFLGVILTSKYVGYLFFSNPFSIGFLKSVFIPNSLSGFIAFGAMVIGVVLAYILPKSK
ncbi:MAG: hypothetical protein ACK5JH_04080 [Anaerocolumna sp.]